jgi:uncharacterized protein
VNEVMKKLLSLQETDRVKRDVEARLKAGGQRVDAAHAKLERHQSLLEEAGRRAKEAGLIEKQKFGQVDEMERKIRDVQLQLNKASSNTEYQNLKKQIAGMSADRGILEEEALQQAAVREQRERETKVEQEKVQALSAEMAKEQGVWDEEKRELDARLATLQAERAERRQGIPPTWLDRYDRILGSGRFPVLVPVVELYCQGCMLELSVHDMTRAFIASEVVLCKSCQRMLYAETL